MASRRDRRRAEKARRRPRHEPRELMEQLVEVLGEPGVDLALVGALAARLETLVEDRFAAEEKVDERGGQTLFLVDKASLRCQIHRMARPLRIEYEGAIYHVMSRGNARQAIFLNDHDWEKILKDWEETVLRCGWELFSFCLMPNHFHLFFRTPRPNLSRGMQRLLSSYANGFAKRHRRPGHLFQGRFKGELVEDESYFWTVSRYIHLNPVRGKRPLALHPREFPWSSYGGFADKRKRLSWVAYDVLLDAWQGELGGSDASVAYRRHVEQGVKSPPENPFAAAAHGWLLGRQEFIDRIRQEMKSPRFADEVPRARLLRSLDVDSVFAAVSEYYEVDPAIFSSRGNGHIARAVAAWLARRMTSATLRELCVPLGLGRPESVSNLTRRIDRQLKTDSRLRKDVHKLELQLSDKTKNKV